MPEKPAAEPWHLDRRIPIALILAIIGQTARALLMGLREGIYADDQQARALLTAAGLDPDEVLR